MFEVIDFAIQSSSKTGCEATLKVKIGEDIKHVVADGVGPVHALDNALRKALVPNFPILEKVHLCDFWVRVVNGAEGTEAVVEVLVFTANKEGEPWVTRGMSSDIIKASLQALVKSFQQIIKTP